MDQIKLSELGYSPEAVALLESMVREQRGIYPTYVFSDGKKSSVRNLLSVPPVAPAT